MFILIRLTQHVSGIIMPIIRRTDYVNNCTWSMPGCVGSSHAKLGHEPCALYESWLGFSESRPLWKLFGSKTETGPESWTEFMAVYFFYE